jgi:uncharacterized protein YbaP (TraB family)
MPAWTRRSFAAAGLAWAGALTASAAENDTYPFWEVRSGGSKVFLLGDGGSVAATWRSDRIERALAECRSFFREETPGDLTPEAVATLITAGTNAARPLAAWLTPAQQRRVRAAAIRVGSSYERIAQYDPWLAAGSLGVSYAQHASSAAGPGPGPALNAAAAAQGKRIWTEIPDADAYVSFWTGLSPAAQVEQLLFVLDEIDGGPNGYAKAAAAYESGDLGPEIKRVADQARAYPHKYEAEVAIRNRRWPPRIRLMIKNGGASFVFVGADHLFGPEGVLALLEKDGMPPRRI